jgi:hypothetical protein
VTAIDKAACENVHLAPWSIGAPTVIAAPHNGIIPFFLRILV